MAGEQAAAADAELGIALDSGDALNQLDAGPDAAGILPSAAGAAEPLTENRAGSDEAAVALGECSGERVDLARRAHADGDEAGQQVGRDGETGALGNIAHAADDLDAESGA